MFQKGDDMRWPKVQLVPWGDESRKETVPLPREPETAPQRLERMCRNILALAVGKKAVTEHGDEVAVAPYVDVQFYKRIDEQGVVGADLVAAVLVRIIVPSESADTEMHWMQELVLNRFRKAIDEPLSAFGAELHRELAAAGVRFVQLQESRPQWMSASGMTTRAVASCAIIAS